MTDIKIGHDRMGICRWLTVLFVGLKLTGFIAWSWWWVLSPLWIPLAVLGFASFLVLVTSTIVGLFK